MIIVFLLRHFDLLFSSFVIPELVCVSQVLKPKNVAKDVASKTDLPTKDKVQQETDKVRHSTYGNFFVCN